MGEWWLRVSRNLVGQLDGPLHFRFILQPLMSILLATRDGIRDARGGDPAYLWSICTKRGHRLALLQKGWKAVSRVFLLAIGLDVIYQIIALPKFHPLEALLTAVLLAMVPYILFRGPIGRIVRLLIRERRISHPADEGHS
jgi:hypothetical protein